MQRDEFLLNVKRKIETAVLPQSAPTLPPMPAPTPFDPADLISDFIREVEALSGTVHRTGSADAAIEAILGLFVTYDSSDFISWDGANLPLPDLLPRLAAAQLTRHDNTIPVDKAERNAKLAALSTIEIGITAIAGAIAESGAIALISKSGNGRLPSLLPPIHIAIMTTSQIMPTLQHFLAANPDATAQGSNLVFISGPSRTADIEMTLTIGVHGPKALHLILLDDTQ